MYIFGFCITKRGQSLFEVEFEIFISVRYSSETKWFKVGFPTGRDSATFRDKGTEIPSLSRDKRTTGQAQNLAKGGDGLGQPVKIKDRTRDGMLPDFDSLSRPAGQNRTGQERTF